MRSKEWIDNIKYEAIGKMEDGNLEQLGFSILSIGCGCNFLPLPLSFILFF